METQNKRLTASLGPFVVAAALVVGALGGYSARSIAIGGAAAQAVNGTNGEGMALIPRSAREDDAMSSQTALIPRSAREDVEVHAIQAPAPRWTHEDDTSK